MRIITEAGPRWANENGVKLLVLSLICALNLPSNSETLIAFGVES